MNQSAVGSTEQSTGDAGLQELAPDQWPVQPPEYWPLLPPLKDGVEPPVGTQRDAIRATRIADNDMVDTPQELERWSRLKERLEACQPIVSQFDNWDQEAITRFRWHGRLVRLTAVLATGAVILAILQLAVWQPVYSPFRRDLADWLSYVEIASAIFAFLAVGVGLFVKLAHRWQQRRYQAEQCRLLKFGYLLNADKWKQSGLPASQLSCLGNCDESGPLKWVRAENPATNLPAQRVRDLPPDLVSELVDYFLRKRIRFQAAYFRKQAMSREETEKRTQDWPIRLFFASLVAVMLHFVWEMGVEHGDWDKKLGIRTLAVVDNLTNPAGTKPPKQVDSISIALLFLAASLPVLGAGIRTFRGAFEFGRNANRFHALWTQLYQYERALQILGSNGDTAGQVEVLQDVEWELEHEHNSWVRLMVESEWFG